MSQTHRYVVAPVAALADDGSERVPTAGLEPQPGRAATSAQVSGLYTADAVPGGPGREDVRMDVDGRYPQMMASGTIRLPPAITLEWVAQLTATGADTWSGPIVLERSPDASFPWVEVELTVMRSELPEQQAIQLRLLRPGGAARTRDLQFASPFFRRAHFEFDWEHGEAPTQSVDTCAHPNRPAALPCETLTVEQVYERAGFDVATSPGSVVPRRDSGANRLWSDQEMHDAMQTYWSRFEPRAQWAIWVFFASLHEPLDGPPEELGGIMFDLIGRQQRQGTAIFTDSFISFPPPGDPNPAAAIKRALFWTTCHEMGHCFNLAHSWDKTAGRSWMPMVDEPEARSFMNYPYAVRGGERAFYRRFWYRFSKQELAFLRHAPHRFVQPGAAAWFDHHAFEAAEDATDPALTLELRVNRERPVFEFMEPVALELKLTNVSDAPQIADGRVLRSAGSLTTIIKPDRGPAREFVAYARHCWKSSPTVLEPGASMYAPLFAFAGQNGWDLADPGNYTVQVAVHHDGWDIVSNELRLRVSPPHSYEEEALAGDVFSDEVGRTLSFTGSAFLTGANDILREVVDRLGDRRIALHARLALGNVAARDYKQLAVRQEREQDRLEITIEPATEEGQHLIASALIDRAQVAAESLGHIGYRGAVERFSDLLVRHDEPNAAEAALESLRDTLAARRVHGRPVLDQALAEIDLRRRTVAKDAEGQPGASS